jgi:hypothetical protein
MRTVFVIMITCLLSGCVGGSYQQHYIISQYSEEENQEEAKKTKDLR